MSLDDLNTISLLHFNGNLTDESGRVWSNAGSAVFDNTNPKFNQHLSKTGTVVDHSSPATDFIAIGTGDFWVKLNAATVSMRIIDKCGNLNHLANWFVGTENVSGSVRMSFHCTTGSSYSFLGLNTTAAAMVGAWHHVAFVRKSGVLYAYLDGVLENSRAYTNNWTTAGGEPNMHLAGASPAIPNGPNYRLDEFRFSKVARWDANFTPPTSEYAPVAVPPVFVSAETTDGLAVLVTFSKDMNSPVGKHGEFGFTENTSGRVFSAAALTLDPKIISLTVSGAAINPGSDLFLNYTEGTVTSVDTGILASFSDALITNSIPASAPSLLSAVTNDGLTILLSFSKAMAGVSGKHSQFSFKENSLVRSFSAATLTGDPSIIRLTVLGDPISYGAMLMVSYSAGDVLASDGGVLASFSDVSVDNNLPSGEISGLVKVLHFDRTLKIPKEVTVQAIPIGSGEGQFLVTDANGMANPKALVFDSEGNMLIDDNGEPIYFS